MCSASGKYSELHGEAKSHRGEKEDDVGMESGRNKITYLGNTSVCIVFIKLQTKVNPEKGVYASVYVHSG